MPSVQKNNRAAALLAEIREADGLSCERLALLIGVNPEDLRACRDYKSVLPPVAQVRLARAIASRSPRLAARARRLEVQAVAAISLESKSTALHLTAPPKWW
ncbi:MAG TPA: hypothetical protein VJN70_07435 [Gemmatimonadaceae bacterium]|nr:hypothetical protein [Gemmatimonadaceae bacterium]